MLDTTFYTQPLHFSDETGHIGIEIEVEGRSLPGSVAGWRRITDNSLRTYYGEAYEYVSSRPVKSTEVYTHLSGILGRFETKRGCSVVKSPRTSVHVHMNTRGLSAVQVVSWITAYAALEDALLGFCGDARRKNLFCQPLYNQAQAREQAYLLVSPDVRHDRVYFRHSPDNLKYCALNLGAFQRYGSLEFRSLYGTVDLDTIITWIQHLCAVRKFAVSQTPTQIAHELDTLGPDGLCKKVLGFDYVPNQKHTDKAFLFCNKIANKFPFWGNPNEFPKESQWPAVTYESFHTTSEPESEPLAVSLEYFVDQEISPARYQITSTPSLTGDARQGLVWVDEQLSTYLSSLSGRLIS